MNHLRELGMLDSTGSSPYDQNGIDVGMMQCYMKNSLADHASGTEQDRFDHSLLLIEYGQPTGLH
jgi:hypothetical protein